VTLTATASYPHFYKRSRPLLTPQLFNEASHVKFNGMLVAVCFNRPPNVNEVQFWNISDRNCPVLLGKAPWNAGLGAAMVDATGFHIYGSTTPLVMNNQVIHAIVDTTNWTISPSNVVFGASGVMFFNLAVTPYPGGYMLSNEHMFSDGSQSASYYTSTDPAFPNRQYPRDYVGEAPANFWASRWMRYMPDGYFYILSDTMANRTLIARTQTCQTGSFKIATGPYDFFGGSFPGDIFLNGGYDGNVVLEEWQSQVVALFFNCNEGQVSPSYGAIHDAFCEGSLADLFAHFTFPN
jgi:hypothetical protein